MSAAVTAPPEILKLVERFDLHRDDYRSAGYNEAQLRQEFLQLLSSTDAILAVV